MCGICGFVSKRNIRLDDLKRMNDQMYHRGPDDSGEEIYPFEDGFLVGFAQRRLSILDLSPLGHQPMHSHDGRISLVFNGEIYNFLELKEELSDYPFVSTCDTEVIIAAYLKWGIDCVERLNGMYAFALFDRKEEKVYLVRDRIGKKPLYYWKDGENIVFASELKPIMECPGFEKKVNKKVLGRYLYQQYINAPESVFENVYKLEPGMFLCFDKGKISCTRYWSPLQKYKELTKDPVSSYEEAKEGLKQRLKTAVKQRMIADVPLGAFLSGGYDSSLMTAMAQECSSSPVKTFSIGFYEDSYNEAKYAKEVADYLGCNHTELYISEQEMFELVESIPYYYDEPIADSSQIPTMLVSKLAKEQVTVVLSGDGGDEFFCGYNEYDNIALAQKLDLLGGMVYGVCNLPGLCQMDVLNKLPFKVRTIAKNRGKETKTQVCSDNYFKVIDKMISGDKMDFRYPVESSYGVDNWQVRRMLLDMDTYLPGDILCKVDRASMKYSLESRCPILDKEVMEYSYRIPHAYKYHNGVKKSILKDIAYDYIPKELLDRPKVGFGVPLDKWLRGPLREQLLSVSTVEYLKKQGIFEPENTSKIIRDYLATGDGGRATGRNYSKIAWSFYVYQMWNEKFM